MATITKRKQHSAPSKCVIILLLSSFVVFMHFFLYDSGEVTSYLADVPSTKSTPKISVHVSELCSSLQKIEPNAKLETPNPKCKQAQSKPGLEPAFAFGSFLPPNKVMYHMGGDFPHFQLMKEQTENKKNSITFDIGANQGFFSFYIAALGLDVHSFEIDSKNFEALQHGVLYNTPEIANHVNLYKMGMSHKDARMGMAGGGYTGFLKEDPNGDILSLTMDCFASHRSDLFEKDISFVKIDVEGFEIGVLEGAKQSLLSPNRKVGSLIIEVGPNRWKRADVSLEKGIQEMAELSTHFSNSYVVFRFGDTCPGRELVSSISANVPDRKLFEVVLYKMTPSDWKPLLELMNKKGSDCNFWFTNT